MSAMLLNVAAAAVSNGSKRVLTYGDSIVDGWISFSSGPRERFAPHLQKALAEQAVDAEVVAIGQAGRPASKALHHLKSHLTSHSYDVVMILLGTNDLYQPFSNGHEPSAQLLDETIRHLQHLHAAVRESGAQSVALGLLHHPLFQEVRGGRRAIDAFNARIAQESGANAFIDTAHLLSSDSKLWSSDKCHLQSSGYIELGTRLAQPLINLLELK